MNKTHTKNPFLTDQNRSNCLLEKIGTKAMKTALFLAKWRPAAGFALSMVLVTVFAAVPGLAQNMPNPFGGSGTSKLANAGSNVLVILTWGAFLVGIVSFILIPFYIKFNKPYSNCIIAGVVGIGGWAIVGSIAYDIFNLTTIDMPDPTTGR